MNILFLHGWQSTPGGRKPTYLRDHGHTVLNPALPDDDFDTTIRIVQTEFYRGKPDVVELARNSGMPSESFIEVGTDHRLADPEPLKTMLAAVESCSCGM